MKFTAAITLLLATGAAGFVPTPNGKSSTALNMSPQEGVKKAAASLVAAAFIMTNAPIVEPAVAFDDTVFGSSQVVAARSGGRAGGRSSAARAPAARAPTRVIQRTTYVQPSPVIVAPTPVYGGYGYNPVPGLGLSIGLNAMNQIGNDMRDYRQENEIRSTQAQLQDSRMREAELEARLRQLEMANQNQQLTQQQQQQLMMQQQMMMQQAK